MRYVSGFVFGLALGVMGCGDRGGSAADDGPFVEEVPDESVVIELAKDLVASSAEQVPQPLQVVVEEYVKTGVLPDEEPEIPPSDEQRLVIQFDTETPAQRYKAIATDAIVAGSQAGAIWALAHAVIEDPEDPVLLSELGFILNYAEEYPKAKVFLLRARFVAPDFHPGRSNLCHYYIAVGDLDRAAVECAWVASSQPYIVHYKTRLAQVYQAQGEFDLARLAIAQALLLDPSDARALHLEERLRDQVSEPYVFTGDEEAHDAAQEIVRNCLNISEFDSHERQLDSWVQAAEEAGVRLNDRYAVELGQCVATLGQGGDCDVCAVQLRYIEDLARLLTETWNAYAVIETDWLGAFQGCVYEAGRNRADLSEESWQLILGDIRARRAEITFGIAESYLPLAAAHAGVSAACYSSPLTPESLVPPALPGEENGGVDVDVCPPRLAICFAVIGQTVTAYSKIPAGPLPLFVRFGATADMRTGDFLVSFGFGVDVAVPFTNLHLTGGAETIWHTEHGVGVRGYARSNGPLRLRVDQTFWTFEGL